MDATFKNDENLPIATEATPLLVRLAQAEMDQAVTTARAFPRSIQKAMTNILSLATLDETTAQECIYALPRDGKPIKGPSVRLAEIIASQWGNCHIGSRIVAVDRVEKVVVAEGVFHDLETGMKRVAQIHRRISDKYGKLFNDDMIAVTGNAAASIALREAILKGVPKAIWRKAYEAAEHVINGDVKTLVQRRDEVIKAFAAWGITPEQIYACIEVNGPDDVGLEEIGTLRAIFVAIKSGESSVEDYFPPNTDKAKATEAARGTATKSRHELQQNFRKQEAEKKSPPVARREDSPKAAGSEQKAAQAATAPREGNAAGGATEPAPAAQNTKIVGGEPGGLQRDGLADNAPVQEVATNNQDATSEAAQVEDHDEDAAVGDLFADDTAQVIDLMDHPVTAAIIADASDMGAEAARSLHETSIAALKEHQPEVFEALDADLDRIGG